MQPIVLITGGSRGIGAATALLAARKGYAVAVNYTSNSLAADEVVRQIRDGGGSAITVQADVAVESQVLAMFDKIDAKLGPLSSLVNNAGVVDVACRVDTMTVERLQRMFTTNIIGSFVCAREAVKRMSTRPVAGLHFIGYQTIVPLRLRAELYKIQIRQAGSEEDDYKEE